MENKEFITNIFSLHMIALPEPQVSFIALRVRDTFLVWLIGSLYIDYSRLIDEQPYLCLLTR